jgi:ABC-type transport system involved in cytochrome bd biosynthesis fused ATPase/permease subunit
VLLALVFALRGLLAWAFEVAGARAASTVLSELRLELVARRLRAQPAALDGVEAGELAAVGVQGVDAARRVLRPLPPAGRARVHRSARHHRLGRRDRPHRRR